MHSSNVSITGCRHLSMPTHEHACAFAWLLLMQGGYLERHKRRRPSDAVSPFEPSESIHNQAVFSDATLPDGASFHSNSLLSGGILALGNFTDAIHTNLDLLTLSNVPPGSHWMWIHLVSVYVITIIALKVSSTTATGQVPWDSARASSLFGWKFDCQVSCSTTLALSAARLDHTRQHSRVAPIHQLLRAVVLQCCVLCCCSVAVGPVP